MLKYKTNLAGVNLNAYKKQLYEALAEYETPIKESDGVFSIIYHAVKVIRYIRSEDYCVKIYTPKEKYVELTNVFLIKILIDSIKEEIIVTAEKQAS